MQRNFSVVWQKKQKYSTIDPLNKSNVSDRAIKHPDVIISLTRHEWNFPNPSEIERRESVRVMRGHFSICRKLKQKRRHEKIPAKVGKARVLAYPSCLRKIAALSLSKQKDEERKCSIMMENRFSSKLMKTQNKRDRIYFALFWNFIGSTLTPTHSTTYMIISYQSRISPDPFLTSFQIAQSLHDSLLKRRPFRCAISKLRGRFLE